LRSERQIVPDVKIGEAGGVTEALNDLEVGLRRHDHEHAKDQWDQESCRARADEGTEVVLAQHETGGDAGNQKQQRQPPGIDDQHQGLEPSQPVLALDVKPPGHVEHADVVEDQEPER